jgi:hypothetical protein
MMRSHVDCPNRFLCNQLFKVGDNQAFIIHRNGNEFGPGLPEGFPRRSVSKAFDSYLVSRLGLHHRVGSKAMRSLAPG